MKVDNPLSRDFLQNFPTEAARTLEQVSPEHVAALFDELSSSQVVNVLVLMLPEKAAACLDKMSAEVAARLLTELPLSNAARIYRLLNQSKEAVSTLLTEKRRKKIRHHLLYSAESAGALLNSSYDMLPHNINVADAIHRLERQEHVIAYEVYVVDDLHHLLGSIALGRLLTSHQHTNLHDIMNRKTQPISVHASIDSLLSHPGWETHRSLPMVERDGTLVGVLDYDAVRDAIGESEPTHSRDPLENILSLASLYWLSLAQLLDSVLSIARPGAGPGSQRGEKE